MAEAVVPERSSEAVSQIDELPRFERRQAVHGRRFLIGYAVVVLMVGAAIIALAYMTREDTSPAAAGNWASWTPPSGGFQSAREIAQRISSFYQGADGEQLAGVVASPGEVQGMPLRYVAIRAGSAARNLRPGDISVLDPGETVLFAFCGLSGRNCSLPGRPSLERGVLLRREALELSLYTFKHMNDVQTVISLLPPTEDTTLAVFLQRRHVEDALNRPLAETLPSDPPHSVDSLAPTEAAAVGKYTGLRTFASNFEQAPDQSIVLRLQVPQ